MIASCAFSRSASSARPPFSNASIESRRIFTWRFSTSLIAASSSRSGALALATLRFLALASGCRALVVLAPAGLREDPSLLDLLVETAEGGLERLTFADDHFGHAVCQVTPLSVIQDDAGAPRGAADRSKHTSFGPGLLVKKRTL